MKTPSLSNNLRDHLFVLAWIVLAVVAKYSISLTSAPAKPGPMIDHGLATAPAMASPSEAE